MVAATRSGCRLAFDGFRRQEEGDWWCARRREEGISASRVAKRKGSKPPGAAIPAVATTSTAERCPGLPKDRVSQAPAQARPNGISKLSYASLAVALRSFGHQHRRLTLSATSPARQGQPSWSRTAA
ncbi:hypothetical protein Droror1_Dr00000106 [Drosera rotundifolia]